MSNTKPSAVWPIFSFRDPLAEMEFLKAAFGLEETAVIARDGDPSIIEHGEMKVARRTRDHVRIRWQR